MAAELTDEGCPRVLGGGRYVLGELLGQGGGGIVYRARSEAGPCAVKLRAVPEEKIRAARFLAESIPMSRVRHPRVVRVLGTGRDAVPAPDGEPVREFYWIAMELCENGTIADLVKRGPLEPDRALELAEQALDGLSAVHAAGFVHRDVKPHNLFLDAEGGVMVGDFGVARHVEGGLWFRTGTGQGLGTAGYRAPEQDMNAKEAGPAADVYGMAATLWFMLVGRRPPLLYAAELHPEILDPLPEAYRPLIRACSTHDPGQRVGTAGEMRAQVRALRDALRREAGLPPLRPDGWLARARTWWGG